MKKVLLFSLLCVVVAASCKKNYSNPSTTVDVSFPTITPIQLYFSVPVGSQSLPVASAIATAYDSVYRQSCPLVVNDTSVHTSTPGLYQAYITATSHYGYVTNIPYYVAVTSITGTAPNLAGTYQQVSTLPLDSFANVVTSLGNGFYQMTNFNDSNVLRNPNADSTAIFALITNNTIAFAGAGPSAYEPITGNWGDLSFYAPLLWNPWPSSLYYGVTGTVTYGATTDTISYNGYQFVN